jgi:hypothetical protein
MITVVGNQVSIDGARVRAALETIDGPCDEAKLLRMYKATMAKLDQQERSRGPLGQLWSAMTGFRLLAR